MFQSCAAISEALDALTAASLLQVAGQAVPITKEATGGIVRPGGKEVSRIADKYSDDATKARVQVSPPEPFAAQPWTGLQL